MSGELAVVEPTTATIDVGHWADTLAFAARLADTVHNTEFVPRALRGRPEAVAATIMYGAEIGVTPMQALAGIHIVEGRPAPSAELMRAMVLRAGHTITVHEFTGTRVRVSGLRRGQPESNRVAVEWTTDMARAAGLLTRPNWRNYPRAMLLARATSDLARLVFPDVVKGLGYVAEESATEDDAMAWGPPEVGEAPARKTRTLQRKAAKFDSQVTAVPPPPVAPTMGVPTQPAPPMPGVEDTPLPPLPAEVDDNTTDSWLTDEEAAAHPVCTNCGDHLAAWGQEWCTDCLEAKGESTEADDLAVPLDPSTLKDPYAPEDVPLPPEMQPRPPVPLPAELQPEAPGPVEPPPSGAGPFLIGQGPLKALHTLLTRELGSAASREERHAMVSAILGVPIESTRDLTRVQGMAALSMFDRFATGEAGWRHTGDPAVPIEVWDTREDTNPREDT